MEILLTLNDEFDPNAGGMGVTAGLLAAYRARGHRADCFSFGDLPARLPFRAKSLLFPELVAARLLRSEADVIDSAVGDGWLLALLARRRRRRPLIVARSHGLIHFADRARREEAARGGLDLSWKYPLYWGGLRIREATTALRSADLCLFLNDQERDFAVATLGIEPVRAAVVDNGLPDALLGLPAPSPPTGDGFAVAHLGSYLELKGVRYVAAAMSALMARDPAARITYLGPGCAPERIRADYPEPVRARVEVVPAYARAELPQLLRGHAAVVSATLKEGFPLGTLEAMACGLAALTAATPGPLQYVRDGENGLVVPQADSAALLAALERLRGDRALLERLRASAHATAQRYSWGRIADETLALYGAALERRATAPPD